MFLLPTGSPLVSLLRLRHAAALLLGAVVVAASLPPAVAAEPEKMLIPGLNLTMVRVPRGTFVMGRPEGYPGSSADEKPATMVTFSRDFWLGATDVTVAQFRQFVDATKYVTEPEQTGGIFMSNAEKREGTSWRNPGYAPPDNHPVVGVSWNDALKFCAWLNAREKAAGRLPAGHVYTLPTEAQWEYAARAGSTDDPEPDEYSWYDANSGGKIQPVGMKKPNPFGLHDMLGLVWQWVLDWRAPYPGGHVVDWTGPELGTTRMNRSGSFNSPKGHGIMSTNRWSTPGVTSRAGLGFRVALSVPPAPRKYD